jgi:hypothetical protein
MTQDFRFFRTRGPKGEPIAARVDEQYVCDFCLHPEPRWEFPARPVAIVGHPAIDYSEDEFLACDECRRLIDQQAIGALVERSCHEQRRHVPPGAVRGSIVAEYPPLPIQRRIARENIMRFMDARAGEARPFRA